MKPYDKEVIARVLARLDEVAPSADRFAEAVQPYIERDALRVAAIAKRVATDTGLSDEAAAQIAIDLSRAWGQATQTMATQVRVEMLHEVDAKEAAPACAFCGGTRMTTTGAPCQHCGSGKVN